MKKSFFLGNFLNKKKRKFAKKKFSFFIFHCDGDDHYFSTVVLHRFSMFSGRPWPGWVLGNGEVETRGL